MHEHQLRSQNPGTIAQKFNLENAFVLEIDTGWNGVNSYGFIVPEVPED